MFKVVPDQLKISDGWVRCGHCADVFDARLYLETWVPPVPPPAPIPAPQAVAVQSPEPKPVAEPLVTDAVPDAAVFLAKTGLPPDEPSFEPMMAEDQATEAPAPWSTEPIASVPDVEYEAAEPDGVLPTAVEDGWLVSPESVSDSREQEMAAQTVWHAPVSTPEPVTASSPLIESVEAAVATGMAVPASLASDPPVSALVVSTHGASQEPEPDFQAELQRFAAASSGAEQAVRADPPLEQLTPEAAEVDDGSAFPADEPGFVRQARRRAFWRSPSVRAALAVLTVLLTALLAAQWALHDRDRLAASHPDLAPLLARLCEPLGCEIGPVRRIDAVVIDSSTLVRRLGNFYSFDLVLKNAAATPVAVPALELSLTDTRDSVIARRVFLPQELPGAPRLVPARGSLSLSLRLSITEAGAVPMAGYRALVFYP